jgi:branched-chain amino acid transport system ATP-binding protein
VSDEARRDDPAADDGTGEPRDERSSDLTAGDRGGDPLLEVEHIAVDRGELRAVEDVSVAVRTGELVAMVGGNGAGKSTTLRAISGLERVRAGAIRFDGHDLTRLSPDAIVDLGIAHVPEGRRLFPAMTVRENLLMGAYTKRARAARVEALARVTDRFPVLADRMEQTAGTMSGGEQQMLAIGRALMSGPRLLLLDEPSLALAPKLVAQVFEIIAAVHAEGIAVLLVEQNIQHALQRADFGYVIETGRTVHAGPGTHLVDHPITRKAYLGA